MSGRLFILFLLLFAFFSARGEDSLRVVFEKDLLAAKSDTAKINRLLILSRYLVYEDNQKAEEYAGYALQISKRINNDYWVARSCLSYSSAFQFSGKYDKAIEYALEAIELARKIKDPIVEGDSYNAMGLIFQSQGNFEEALVNFKHAIDLLLPTADKRRLARSVNNAGNSYFQMGKYNESVPYYELALSLRKEVGQESGIADSYNDLSNALYKIGKKKEAIPMLLQAHQIKKKIEDTEGIAFTALNLAVYKAEANELDSSEYYLDLAFEKAELISAGELLLEANRFASELYAKKQNPEYAFYFYVDYITLKDSLYALNNSKMLAEMEARYKSEKKQLAIKALEDEQKLSAIKNSKLDAELSIQQAENNIYYYSIAFSVLAILLITGLALFLRNYLRKSKEHEFLLAQKNELYESKNKVLSESLQQIREQHHQIEEKNHEITSSITYARRIQDAILPSAEWIASCLPKSFILYKPKDIVAGDFYWIYQEENSNKILFAVCDCTGHGVPGAMVSVVAHNALHRAVTEFKLTSPAAILDQVNAFIEETFSSDENEVRDGMDVSLCALDLTTNSLEWSGANNPLWIVRKNQPEIITELKPDKQPIGKYEHRKPFTNHKINLQKEDTIYLFSDGFADQFGGENGKKYKYSRLKELLLQSAALNPEDQKQVLDREFEEWKQQFEQVDDVCIMGVTIA